MAHSFISHDVPDAQGKLKYVYEAYKHMSQDPRLNTILKTVAASKTARIIYDFNRDAVNIADPTTSGNTEGVFYPMGRIYIGARQLLDEETRSQAISTLAHELCHYAVNLVYSNHAQPYKSNDNQTMQEFEEINTKCQTKKGKEEIVDLVYEFYEIDMHHAELIVRPAHMIAMYMDQPEKLAEQSQIFPELFEFFEKVIKEMEAAIPEIERRDEVEAEKKDQKISNLRKKLVLSAIFSVIGIIVVAAIVAVIFHKPIYNFKDLSPDNKLKITSAPVIYKDIEVRFHDLFPNNSTAYYELTSDHISQILDGQALDFSDSHFQYLNNLVNHDWKNLAGKLKQKFLTSNFTFQNESLKFEKLAEISSEVFNSLSSEQIVDVLDGKELVIGSMIQNRTEFYLERKLIFEDIKVGYIFVEFLQNFKNKTVHELFERFPEYKVFLSGVPYEALIFIENLQVDKFTLQDIYALIHDIGFDIYAEVVKEIEKQGFIKDYDQFLADLNSDKLKFIQHDFDKVFQEAKKSKIFILSSEAGAGKTVTFEQLAMRIKKKNPIQWVSYIDMKDFVNLYKRFKDAEELLTYILRLGSENEFEKKVFEVLYKSGNAVLLWNGFDEISPDYNKFIIDILTQVRENTLNVQFISTRPLFSLQLRDKFKKRTFQLIPYSKTQQKEFLRKFFTSKNVEKSKIDRNIGKIQKIIKSLLVGGLTSEAKETTRDFNTPLMLKLVAEIYVDNDQVESDNFYEIYQQFVEKKVGVWLDSSPFVKNIVNKLLSRSFNIIEIYQKYSLPNELYEALHLQIIFELKKLKVMSRQIPSGLPKTEISRMGILYINDDTKFEFAHKTLEEFFTAQYFIENIYNADYDVSPEEAYYRLEIFFYIAQNYGYNQVMVTDFMISYLDKVNGVDGQHRVRRGIVMENEGDLRLGRIDFDKKSSKLRLGSDKREFVAKNEILRLSHSESVKNDTILRLGPASFSKTDINGEMRTESNTLVQNDINLRLGSKSRHKIEKLKSLRLSEKSKVQKDNNLRLGTNEAMILTKNDTSFRLGINSFNNLVLNNITLRLNPKNLSTLIINEKIMNNPRVRRATETTSYQMDDHFSLDHKMKEDQIQNLENNDFLTNQSDASLVEPTSTENQDDQLNVDTHNLKDSQQKLENRQPNLKDIQHNSQIQGITPFSDSNKPFSLEIAKLVKTKFKKFLFDLVNPKYPEILKFMLDFFKKDHALLLELLNVNDDETLYTAAFNPNHFVALANPEHIKAIVRSYLNDEEFERFLTGRNQNGKVLLGLHYYKQKNKPKKHDKIKISLDSDIQEDTDLYDYSDMITANLTDLEKKQFFFLAITPPFYSALDTSKIPKHEKLWQQFQNLLSKSEIQSAIADTIHKLIKKYPEFDDFARLADFLPFLLNKTEELLLNSEIFEMFFNFDILHIATYNHKAFDVLWTFVETHFDDKQQKTILQRDDKPKYYRKYDSFNFYHNIPLKIIHKASLRNNENILQTVKSIYSDRFSVEEFQAILMSPNEYMLQFVICWKYRSAKIFEKYFIDLFENDKKVLKEFLNRKFIITNKSIFESFKDIRGEYYDRLQKFHDLY
ncbi:hypothetical protein ACKWTF_015081 [Chironomus riparius]